MKIAVLFVLVVHGIGLMALLMQGCGQSQETLPPIEATDTNPPPTFADPVPPPVATNPPPVADTTPTPVEPPPAPPPVAPAGINEHTIVKGDYLEKIAKNFHVSVNAIMEANPGIEPTKLKIGQKIYIPSPAVSTAPAVTGLAPGETAAPGGEQTYTVKSGDTLTRIAGRFGTTVKALRAANELKTDFLKVGQKLRIPASASAPMAAPVVPAEPVPTYPATPPPGP
ncbi:MAG TPA: LysM peptidoglycan-binding domain-containing protein [Verrucomicrobiota bacterium]|nr:LysM peptidoglycan-binding domain-containing protein [Verrucomicrobiota bacterium]